MMYDCKIYDNVTKVNREGDWADEHPGRLSGALHQVRSGGGVQSIFLRRNRS